MDKFANMQAFEAVAEIGSFAGAARKLNITNSVISKRIKDLEYFLSTQLFMRTTRQVTLTDTGRSYLEHVKQILGALQEAEANIQQKRDKPIGMIKISAPLSFGMEYLGSAISNYLDKYPDVQVKTYLSDHHVNLAEEGYDLVIRTGVLEDSNLIAKKLMSCRRVFCATPAYLKKHGRPKTPKELTQHNCLSYLNIADGKAWPYAQKGKRKWQSVSGRFASDNGDLLHKVVLAGKGIALLPTFIVGNSLEEKRLETILTDFEEQDFNLYAVYQNTRYISPKVRTLIDHLYIYLQAV